MGQLPLPLLALRQERTHTLSKGSTLMKMIARSEYLPHPFGGICGANSRLEGLPEIERENILAARLEEVQRYKDAMQLDAMYKMAGMGGDEEEDDDGPSRKRSGSLHTCCRLRDLVAKRRKTHQRDQGSVASDQGSKEQAQSDGRACSEKGKSGPLPNTERKC